MAPPYSHHVSACRCGPRTPAPADAPHSVVRVKGSAGPVKGELEVTSSESQGSPVSTAIAILVLVTAAALAAVAIAVVGWLASFPPVATGLGACGCPRLDLRRRPVHHVLENLARSRAQESALNVVSLTCKVSRGTELGIAQFGVMVVLRCGRLTTDAVAKRVGRLWCQSMVAASSSVAAWFADRRGVPTRGRAPREPHLRWTSCSF